MNRILPDPALSASGNTQNRRRIFPPPGPLDQTPPLGVAVVGLAQDMLATALVGLPLGDYDQRLLAQLCERCTAAEIVGIASLMARQYEAGFSAHALRSTKWAPRMHRWLTGGAR